jgi:hypothetical protein
MQPHLALFEVRPHLQSLVTITTEGHQGQHEKVAKVTRQEVPEP